MVQTVAGHLCAVTICVNDDCLIVSHTEEILLQGPLSNDTDVTESTVQKSQ